MAHTYLKPVGSGDSFILKVDHNQVMGEVSSLAELRDVLAEVSTDVIAFHMDNRNDFASWVNEAIGCKTLGSAMADVEIGDNAEEARKQLLGALNFTLDLLTERPRRRSRKKSR